MPGQKQHIPRAQNFRAETIQAKKKCMIGFVQWGVSPVNLHAQHLRMLI